MKIKLESKGIPLDKVRLKGLKNPERASYAMKLALQEFEKNNNIDVLLDTLRLVVCAQDGGIAGLARKISISRQALTKALSPEGNPRLDISQRILADLGLRISLKVNAKSVSQSGKYEKKNKHKKN